MLVCTQTLTNFTDNFFIDAQFTWIVVFLATVFLGVDLGLGVGVGFAMLLVVIRTVL